MPKNKVIANLDLSNIETTSHSLGKKLVFFNKNELQSSITQIALGILDSGEIIPFHSHESMEEVFYILSGNGIFHIEDEKINVKENSCIRIPLGFSHSIKANTQMKFLYFGVATN